MAFDASEYRQNTYGLPNRYCDPCRSLSDNSGTGLSESSPWNMTQARELCSAGMVIGIMPVGSGRTPVSLASSGSGRIPAFDVRASGNFPGDTTARRITYVTKHAAVALSGVATNPLRSEMRLSASGTRCPLYGSYFRSYVTFDGLYTDMAHAMIGEDTGLIRAENATSIWFLNFELKGTATTINTNCIMYRPEACSGNILRNFRAYDFTNTGSQGALFSDQYGDANFTIENFEISNIQEAGPYLKGTSAGAFNYGLIRYGIVHDCGVAFQFNDLHATNLTTLEYCLAYSLGAGERGALSISSETSAARNLLVHHCTFAKCAGTTGNSALYTQSNGFASGTNNVTIRDNIFDSNTGSGEIISYGEETTLPQTQNYNGYYKQGAALSMSWSGSPISGFSTWQSTTGRDQNSRQLTTTPFRDWTGNDFRLSVGHEAATASSTGGQLGVYAMPGGTVLGVDAGSADTTPPAVPTGLTVR